MFLYCKHSRCVFLTWDLFLCDSLTAYRWRFLWDDMILVGIRLYKLTKAHKTFCFTCRRSHDWTVIDFVIKNYEEIHFSWQTFLTRCTAGRRMWSEMVKKDTETSESFFPRMPLTYMYQQVVMRSLTKKTLISYKWPTFLPNSTREPMKRSQEFIPPLITADLYVCPGAKLFSLWACFQDSDHSSKCPLW